MPYEREGRQEYFEHGMNFTSNQGYFLRAQLTISVEHIHHLYIGAILHATLIYWRYIYVLALLYYILFDQARLSFH